MNRSARNNGDAYDDLSDIAEFCEVRHFAPGDKLREKGEFYRNMYLVVGGEVSIGFETDAKSSKNPIVGPPGPIGEIGFLYGESATATVVASKPTAALHIDDAVLSSIERRRPDLAARFLQTLADTAEYRTSYNLAFAEEIGIADNCRDIEVLLCRTDEMRLKAQQLRYDVYCRELGRDSPHANHDTGTIADELDSFAIIFVALQKDEVVGTFRGNISREGPIGVLEQL